LTTDGVEEADFMDYVKWIWDGWKLSSDSESIH